MKKSLSILLLILLLFNMMGFPIHSLLETTNYEDKTSFLIEKSNILLKVPLCLPYVNDWEGTEAVGQELLHKEDFYHVVSQKISSDTLYVQCEFKESARDRFWGLVSDFDGFIKSSKDSGSKQTGNLMKHFFKEYMSPDCELTFYILEWLSPQRYPNVEIADLLGENLAFFAPPDFI